MGLIRDFYKETHLEGKTELLFLKAMNMIYETQNNVQWERQRLELEKRKRKNG